MTIREFTPQARSKEEAMVLIPLVETMLELRTWLGNERFSQGIQIARDCVKKNKRDAIPYKLIMAGIETGGTLSAILVGTQLRIVYEAFQEDFDKAFDEEEKNGK